MAEANVKDGALTGAPIARVALDVPLAGLFDYLTPEPVQIGQRVQVAFGPRKLVGVVMALAQTSDLPRERLRPLLQVLPDSQPLSPGLLAILRFCSDYYRFPIGPTVLGALPTRLRTIEPLPPRASDFVCLSAQGAALDLDTFPARKRIQRLLLQHLAEGPCSRQTLHALASTAAAQLKDLQAQHLVEPCAPPPRAVTQTLAGAHVLNASQQAVVDRVRQAAAGCFLLQGVTGSGKTEVYVHLMHAALQAGGQVLLLVPEINLTPQLEQYFRSRLPDACIASLHSGLSEGERLRHWEAARDGQADIVLGTRLAVFSELPRLALILVDEEHDPSYKQQEGLRYSARDVAIFRARQASVPIVLGSATPSLESYYNARSGRYAWLTLPARAHADAVLPAVRCVHTRQEVMQEGVSEPLLRAVADRLRRGEQSLLFLNRRGYAPVLMCTGCGWMSECRDCASKMVLHSESRRLRCHHCGSQSIVPRTCPDCGHETLLPVGSGTQRVEEVIRARFPDARVLRVDRDSTRNKHTWRTMQTQIRENEVDILIGTQMLAKGHDFPALTLVGVLNPDSALYSADFRAPERLFAQLVQVAGRAGRAGLPGEVLVQTAFPDHPLFIALQRHDFDTWAQRQLEEREQAGFPPFCHQVVLRAEGDQSPAVFGFLEQARAAARQMGGEVEVYGVVPAAMPRRARLFQGQLLIQAARRSRLHALLEVWQPRLHALECRGVRWLLDIDPQSF